MSTYLVYKATSPSGKSYIGMTKKTLLERQKEHEWHSKSNKRKKIFHSALQKYEYKFVWEVLVEGLTKQEAEEKEINYISSLKTINREFGYNQAKGGMSGDIMSEESREKWRQSMQKYYSDPQWCKNISKHLGKKEDFKKWLDTDNDKVRAWKKKCSDNLKEVTRNRDVRLKKAIKRGGKPFICVETGETFQLLQDAADKFGVDKRRIWAVLKRPNRYKSILNKYTFKYIS